MLNLVMKDILIQKKNLISILIVALIFVPSFGNSMGIQQAAIMGCIICTFQFISHSCGYDDKNKSELVLNSLPIRRHQIVTAKYLSSLIFSVATFFLSIGLLYIFKNMGFINDDFYFQKEYIITVFISISIMISIFFPVYFKLGYLKSRLIIFIVFFGIGTIPTAIIALLKRIYTQQQFEEIAIKLISFLNRTPDFILASVSLLVIALFIYISLCISISFYKKRDF
ncbi:membrane protein [Fervidicella metallireducens AeB]|uniref:Membrane protein n=1 Tax=Fervidicella metallireducens AeB TaxID=1403537 RepID=A0A017RWB1_9CLOT|nr:ABC-2 transporter permease [Fervidicella metallireducens]EYE88962.1 membrane protein [Fervidicella metallireducens AeB]